MEFGSLKADVGSLKSGQARLETNVKSLTTGLAETRAEMRVLHEATRAEIRLVAEIQAAHRDENARGFEGVRKELADGLAPLSDSVRHHTAILKDHKL